MDGTSIIQSIMGLSKELDGLVEDIYTLGEKQARAERDYRIRKREAELYYRDKKYPANLIGDLAKGQADIADLAYARDLAQYAYDANKEAVMAKKLVINAMRDVYNNEWSRSK